MTAKQVYRKIGGRTYGKEAVDGLLERIRKAHNLKILGTEESADENGRHSHAMVLFGYDNSWENVDKAYKDFEEARCDLSCILEIFGLELAYECNGDGDGCILMSYRII